MRIKYRILILVNDESLRHALFREFEDESDFFYGAQFSDIIAEIKWQDLDVVIIDQNDEGIDTIGIIQLINSTCPTVGIVLLSDKHNMVLDQLTAILPQTKIVLGTRKAKEIAPTVKAAIRKSKRARSKTIGGIGGREFADKFQDINEHLILSMMGVNEIAAGFQLDRSELTKAKLYKMENFCEDLDELVNKYKDDDENFDEDEEIKEEFSTINN